MSIKTVVFDLGGVLIDWNPRYLYRKIFGTEDEVEHFLENICTSDWNAEQDAGRSFKEAVRLLQKKYPEYAIEIAAYDERWQEMLGPELTPTINVLKDVHKNGTQLFALTNWSSEKFRIAKPQFPFLELFENILVSGEVGLKKPDIAIFKLFLDKYRLTAATTFYIDDNLENVEVALSLGMQAIQFSSAQQLRNELVNIGVLQEH